MATMARIVSDDPPSMRRLLPDFVKRPSLDETDLSPSPPPRNGEGVGGGVQRWTRADSPWANPSTSCRVAWVTSP
jgi:hypothetical protein